MNNLQIRRKESKTMSAICILVPTVVATWPVISAAVAGAAAALGMTLAREGAQLKEVVATPKHQSVEVALNNSEVVAEGLVSGEEMILEKGNMRARVYRDERGECRVCVEGEGYSKTELSAFGEQLAGKITQIFVYNKVMTELGNKGFVVVNNEMSEDQTVHLHVRRTVN